MIQFRDYQQGAIDASLNYLHSSYNKPVVVTAPTAAGKSWIIAGIANKYDGPILILQPSLELLKQNYEKFTKMGGKASIYSAGAKSKEIGHVTYATLGSIKKNAQDFKDAGVKVVLIDECHHGYSPEPSSMFRIFMKQLNPQKVIGLTATPFRLKNNMAGSRLVMLNRMRPGYFREFIHITQIKELIDRGYWCKSVDETWTMNEDMLELNSTGSDFTEESIKEYVETNGINNKIYLRILDALKQGRKHILVFADSVESAEIFVDHMRREDGITCDYLSSKTKSKERKRIVEGFKSGDIQVVFNYGILGTGFDFPELDCIIMGRPTNSLALFYQIYGRGVRILEGKEDFLFSDFGNNFKRLAHPRDIRVENLDGYGWAVFAGDRLVTDILLGSPDITKEDLSNRFMEDLDEYFFKFGKYEGRKILDVARKDPGYISWTIENTDWHSTFKSKLREALKIAQIERVKGVRLVKKVA